MIFAMKYSAGPRTKLFFILAAVVMIAFSSLPAAGQAFTPARIAVIDSDAFNHKTAGITRMVKTITALNAEFKPTQDEINRLADQAKSLQKEIEALYSTAAPTTIRAKGDTLEQLQRDIKRKSENAQEAFDRRQKIVMEPVLTDISNAIEAYAKKRGIDIVIDLAKFDGVYLYNDAVNITAAFIADYNTKTATP